MVTEVYKFGEFRLDVVERRLYRREVPVQLPSKTFDILKLLVERKGDVVTKEELIRRVWPGQFVEEGNLTVRMSALRKALDESPEYRFIETVSGHGYRFVARIREERGSGVEAFRSLAILPLAVEGNQQRLNYISEGIVESLINSLSRLPNLKVMARSTVFGYRANHKDPQVVGEELRVEAVLTGRISQVNDSMIVSVELVDARDGSQVWGARYRRRTSELFALQEDVANELALNLRPKLTGIAVSPQWRGQTGDSEAYRLYLKGRYFFNNQRSVQGIKKAITFFRRAIKKDANLASAYSGLTDCYITISMYGLAPPKTVMPKAKAAALQALKLDDSLGEAHASLATIKANYDWDWGAAKAQYQRALELNPNLAHARHAYANYLAKVGQTDEAIAELEKARALDPLSLNVNVGLAKMYYLAGRYDEGLRQCIETLEIDPDFAPANGVAGMIRMKQGLYEEAIAEIKRLISFSSGGYELDEGDERPRKRVVFPGSDPEAVALLGHVYAVSGKVSAARKILNSLIGMSKARYVEPHAVALVYAGLGDKEGAFDWLEKAFKDRSTTLTYIKVWPEFDSLRPEPRYADLVRRMGLPP